MPFRRAHVVLLALFPLILLAFWPNYLGRLGTASFALHAHGITACAWIALAAFQAWTIDARQVALHRSAGLALFALVPLFTAAGLLAMRDMAVLGVAAADPFHAGFGVPLSLLDAVSVATFLVLVGWGVAQRRRAAVHAGAMMGTVLLVMPPVLGRLAGALPLPDSWFRAVPSLGFHLGELAAAALSLLLVRREPGAAAPLRLVAAVLIVQSLALETAARSATWAAFAAAFSRLPALLVVLFGLTASAAVLWTAWFHRPRAARPRAAAAA